MPLLEGLDDVLASIYTLAPMRGFVGSTKTGNRVSDPPLPPRSDSQIRQQDRPCVPEKSSTGRKRELEESILYDIPGTLNSAPATPLLSAAVLFATLASAVSAPVAPLAICTGR